MFPPACWKDQTASLAIQSKNIVIDFFLVSINGLVLSRDAARILLLLDSMGYHSYTPFGKGGETEPTETFADPSCKEKLCKKIRSSFLILTISCPLEV